MRTFGTISEMMKQVMTLVVEPCSMMLRAKLMVTLMRPLSISRGVTDSGTLYMALMFVTAELVMPLTVFIMVVTVTEFIFISRVVTVPVLTMCLWPGISANAASLSCRSYLSAMVRTVTSGKTIDTGNLTVSVKFKQAIVSLGVKTTIVLAVTIDRMLTSMST